ncbi:GspH/FimT family protein [Thermodesulfobacteriota bacterium]
MHAIVEDSRKSRGEEGFTLLELLIAISILLILTSMGFWSGRALLPGYRLKGAASMVRNDLQGARILAAKNHVQYRVVFDSASKTVGTNDYELQQGNLPSGSSAWALELGRTFQDYAGVSVKTVATSNITFNPRGTAVSFGTATLQHEGGKELAIAVSLAGRVKVR